MNYRLLAKQHGEWWTQDTQHTVQWNVTEVFKAPRKGIHVSRSAVLACEALLNQANKPEVDNSHAAYPGSPAVLPPGHTAMTTSPKGLHYSNYCTAFLRNDFQPPHRC